MAETISNLLHTLEPKRDSYGFALRPQHLQRFREYAKIYKEEEEERSQKWKNFLETQMKSAQDCSTVEAHKIKLETESTEQREKIVSDEAEKGDNPSGNEPSSDNSTESNSEREVQQAEKSNSKTDKVQRWADIRPVLCPIESMMSIRVKKERVVEDNLKGVNGDHLPTVEEVSHSGQTSEEDSEGDVEIHEVSNETTNSFQAERSKRLSEESVFPWREELECLVRGGIPKDLRGEVWQAFVGVRARRTERYYEDLLALDASDGDEGLQDGAASVPMRLRKQIEKDVPRTFPGHPALDENGRNSLRRVLIAYARHNPAIGYCQAMNFFAGLLLLVMPEENAFWAFVGIIDDYFNGYYTEDMIESQVDQLVFEDLMRERFPKLVNHLDFLGVQVAWISGPWFLSIFLNMLPWESVLRVWDVLLFEGNRVMLFRTALALMELYGPAIVTTKDAGDAITLLQSLAGSTFDSSQLVLMACMGFLAITEARLHELREKHRPSVREVVEERLKQGQAWKDSKGLAKKLYSFKHEHGSRVKETESTEGKKDAAADADGSRFDQSSNLEEYLGGLDVESEANSLPDLQEQVVWLKVELCRLLEEKRSAILRAEELETALMEMVTRDNRLQLSARVEQLEQEVNELRQALADKKEQETAILQVLMRVEQEQKVTEDARLFAEQDATTQRHTVEALQEKYGKAMASLAQMEKRVVMAESMLEATMQYESGQVKALNSPRSAHNQASAQENPTRVLGLLSRPFGGWRDRSKGKPTNVEEPSENKPAGKESKLSSSEKEISN